MRIFLASTRMIVFWLDNGLFIILKYKFCLGNSDKIFSFLGNIEIFRISVFIINFQTNFTCRMSSNGCP